MEKTGRVEVWVAGERSALLAGLTGKWPGDIVAGGDLGKLSPTGYNDYSADLKWRQKIGIKHELISSVQHQNRL